MRKKIFIVYSLLFTIFLAFPLTSFAMCPVCTVAVGAGLGLSRYFGIDDMISGIWIGGLVVSLSLWTADWLKKKDWKITKRISQRNLSFLSFFFYLIITYPPLWATGIIGHPFNTVLGIDKLIFGSLIGILAFLLAVWADKKVRKLRGKQLFNYQKVVFPVFSLLLFSLVLYFWGGYLK